MLSKGPGPRNSPEPDEIKELVEHLSLVTQLGLIMVAAVGIGFAVGFYLDRWTGSRGLWKAVFIPLGVLSGFWAVYKAVMDMDRRSRDRRR